MRKVSQGRPSDETRVLRALLESDGLSNIRLRTELNLDDGRYEEIKRDLLGKGLIEKYRCRGGGVRLTTEGEKSIPKSQEGPKSSVSAEKALYEPLTNYLQRQAEEDEIKSVPINTANLRSKGKWQNPDITQLTIEQYRYLKKTELIVTTYEVKQWNRWDVGAVFEAASHRRFSHEAVVVLEWVNSEEFSLSDTTYRLDEISRECRRFGVGLYTMRPDYNGSYLLHTHIQANRHTPLNSAVESWLEYLFERLPNDASRYEKALESAETEDR